MVKGLFAWVCIVLAVIFTLAAVKGLIQEDVGPVLLVPVLTAISLIIVAIRSKKNVTS